MLEKLAKSIEEVNVLAEHYRTCQNVAAIESLAKECFISKEDTDAFIAGKRKFLLKVLLTQSVSVTEKLTVEMLLLQDSGYATVLGTYLLDLARKDPVMKDVILQPHKTLRHCIEYVHEKAYETALEKAKKEIRQKDAEIDRRSRIAGVFCKAFEKSVLLEPTEENVRIWVECTRMNREEMEDTAREARELAAAFSSIADVLEEKIMPCQGQGEEVV